MAEQLTVKVPDLSDVGLTDEGKDILVLFMQSLKDQYNEAIADLEARVKALE